MKTSVNAVHHQSNDWIKELQFYFDELLLLQNRLGEVAAKNTGQETMAMIEHFQNKFIMLKEQADILKHDVNANNNVALEMAALKPTHINEKYVTETNDLHLRITQYAKGFADTRFELNQFLRKVM
ncbi:MAG TPA: hypothetical protein VK154_05900 [Chitinophagales bacterium]|nr:hypothetical protein [Chitinophagales bacterium]